MPKLKLNIKPNGKKSHNMLKLKLAHYLELGLTLDDACKLSDCSKHLLSNLRTDLDFEEFIQKALVLNKSKHLENISRAGDTGNWTASAWILERKFPEEFGKKDVIKHEYTFKLQTLQNVFVKILSEEITDPKLRYKCVQRIRNFDFDGSDTPDHSFKPKLLEDKTEIIDIGE
jgi:hypothetical protein